MGRLTDDRLSMRNLEGWRSGPGLSTEFWPQIDDWNRASFSWTQRFVHAAGLFKENSSSATRRGWLTCLYFTPPSTPAVVCNHHAPNRWRSDFMTLEKTCFEDRRRGCDVRRPFVASSTPRKCWRKEYQQESSDLTTAVGSLRQASRLRASFEPVHHPRNAATSMRLETSESIMGRRFNATYCLKFRRHTATLTIIPHGRRKSSSPSLKALIRATEAHTPLELAENLN